MSGENSISSVVASLSGGAGIDIRKLAEDLTNVERAPLEDRLTGSRDREETQISAYSVLKYNIEELISKLEGLDDASELRSSTASSSDATKADVSAVTGAAEAGTHTLAVSSLAAQQINISNTFSAGTQSLNGGSGFNITITDSTNAVTTVSIADGNDTPSGIVAALNSSSAKVSASLLTVDAEATQFRIVIKGETGSSNSFEISSTLTDADMGFHDTVNGNSLQVGGVYSQQLAANASFTLDGVSVQRATNTISDALDGVTLELNGTHASGSTQIKIEKSDNELKSKLQDLVASYNATRFALDEVANPDSADETVGGALVTDFAAVRQVRTVLYRAFSRTHPQPRVR